MERKKISELFDFLPKSKFKASEGQDAGEYAFYTCSDILSKYIDVANFEPNKLIFGTGGSPGLHYAIEPFSTSTDCLVLSPQINFVCKYIYYFLRQNWYILEQGFKGAGLKHISKEYISNIEILIPSLDEQEKIVARLDKANEIKDKKIKANEKLDELIKSQFVYMFGDPVENTKEYPLIKLNNLCSKIGSGATPRGDKESYKEDGISLIRSMNVHNGYFKYDNLAYLDDEQARTLDNVTVEKNDILFNITGASVTRSCVVPNEILPARVNQHVAILRCKEKLNPRYLNRFLTADSVHKYLLLISKSSGATREAITKQQLEDLLIMYPPLEEQNQFAQFVERIEEQKSKNEIVIQKMTNLINSIMQQEFSRSF